MLTYVDNVKREFKNMVRERKSHTDKRFILQSLTVPTYTTIVEPNEDYKLAVIKGVTEPYFSSINNSTVELVGRVKLYKRDTLSDGTIRVDKDGSEIKREVTVPQKSLAILSDTNIKLPNFELREDGTQKKVKITDGFRYVDYVATEKGKKFIYIIPREYIHLLELNALIVTPNKRRSYYTGVRLTMQDGNYIYVYVIPYNMRAYTEVRVLGVKPSCDFNEEIQKLIQNWVENKIVFNPPMTDFEGVNLGYNYEGNTLYEDDYIPYTSSMKEQKELEA